MESKNLITEKDKTLKICKMTMVIMIALAVVLIGVMIAWLLLKKNTMANITLSIIAGILVVAIIISYAFYRVHKKKADQLQEQIDNE